MEAKLKFKEISKGTGRQSAYSKGKDEDGGDTVKNEERVVSIATLTLSFGIERS